MADEAFSSKVIVVYWTTKDAHFYFLSKYKQAFLH